MTIKEEGEITSRTPDPNDYQGICSVCKQKYTMAQLDYDDTFENPVCNKCGHEQKGKTNEKP